MTTAPSPTRPEDDLALLRRYAESGAADAFAIVVARHADFVFATALRQTRDRHLAEDVTQAAFIVLARRARSIRQGASVTAFLHQTTVYAARNAVRSAQRRRSHEAGAAIDPATPAANDKAPVEVDETAAAVDSALSRLRDRDRRLIMLHYFDGLTVAEAAAKLAITHEAARKRLHRALERLREMLQHAGVTTTAASLPVLFAALAKPGVALPAPGTLASAAVAGGKGGSAFALADRVGAAMQMMALKKAAAIAAIVTVLAGSGVAISVATQDRRVPVARQPSSKPLVMPTPPGNRRAVPVAAAATSQPANGYIVNYTDVFDRARRTMDMRAAMEAKTAEIQQQDRQRVANVNALRNKLNAATDPAERAKLEAEMRAAEAERKEVNSRVQAQVQREQSKAMLEIFREIEDAIRKAAAARGVQLPPDAFPPYPRNVEELSLGQLRAALLRRQVRRPEGAPDLTQDVMKLMSASAPATARASVSPPAGGYIVDYDQAFVAAARTPAIQPPPDATLERRQALAMLTVFRRVEQAIAQAAVARGVRLPPEAFPPYPADADELPLSQLRRLLQERYVARPAGAPDLTGDVLELLRRPSATTPATAPTRR